MANKQIKQWTLGVKETDEFLAAAEIAVKTKIWVQQKPRFFKYYIQDALSEYAPTGLENLPFTTPTLAHAIHDFAAFVDRDWKEPNVAGQFMPPTVSFSLTMPVGQASITLSCEVGVSEDVDDMVATAYETCFYHVQKAAEQFKRGHGLGQNTPTAVTTQQKATPQTLPDGNNTEEFVTDVFKVVQDKGKTYVKLFGGQYSKYGLTLWYEQWNKVSVSDGQKMRIFMKTAPKPDDYELDREYRVIIGKVNGQSKILDVVPVDEE